MSVASKGSDSSTLDEYNRLLRTQWSRPVACQNVCSPPESCSCRRFIVHVHDMNQWWQSKASEHPSQTKLERLLDEMPAVGHRTFPLNAPKHQGLFVGEHSCLTVFSLLLSQNRGHLIDRFHDSDMNDRHLDIVRSESDQSLHDNLQHIKQPGEVDVILKEFHDAKWSYCPLKLELHMNRNLHGTRVIPPFCRKIKLGDKGGTASIYFVAVQRVLVTDEALRLAINDSLYTDNLYGECYQMVLKTYCGNKKRVYDLEKEAFNGLSSNDQVPIVRYLGSYTHDFGEGSTFGETYNLLMEKGERDLFQAWADETNVPPVRADEIIRFWQSLFGVADAIRHVHNIELPRPGANAPRKYHGWHADIKPDNILIVRGRLKLADFGFARFAPVVHHEDEGRIPTELIDGFTDTYGAPEVSRMKQPDGTTFGVTQSIDTWSFGCVLSVAATWVVLGFQGIRQFAQLRQLAPSNKIGGITYDRFHNGIEVLPEVRKWHNYLRGHTRPSDTATSRVLELVENNMLQTETANRSELGELCEKLQDIFKWATERVKDLKIHSRLTDPVVLQALYSIEKKAHEERSLERNTTSLSEPTIDFLSTQNPVQRATMQVQKQSIIQKQRLGQTPYRRELLERELKGKFAITDSNDANSKGVHTGISMFSESPTHDGHFPNPVDVTRRQKFRNPEHHPLPATRNVLTTKPAIPRSTQRTQTLGESTQAASTTSNHVGQVEGLVGLKPIGDVLENVLPSDRITYGMHRHVVDDELVTQSPSLSLRSRPPLSLDTPSSYNTRHLPYTYEAQYPRDFATPPDMPVDIDKKLQPMPDFHGNPTVVVSAPLGAAPQPQAKTNWHSKSPPPTISPYMTRPTSQFSELVSHHTLPGQYNPMHDTTEKQAVIEEASQASYEPLPSSALDLPYDVCTVRGEVNRDDPKGRRAWFKGKMGIEERKPNKGLAQTYGDNREIVFLADNGATMFEHWPIVTFVAETMVKRAAGLDKDGVDLRFTIDGSQHNKYSLKRDAGRRDFRAALDAAAPDNITNDEFQTDMFTALEEMVLSWKKKGKPATTLLILTDGKWRRTVQNQVDNIILNLATETDRSKHVGKRTFGIQFIRFGEDCADKLSELDNELCKTRNLRDIVDHCSWRSTVEKMFKGSIDGQYDQHDPVEPPIVYFYQGLVDLFRDFNNNSHHEDTQKRPVSQLLSPTSPRMSLSRSSSRGSDTDEWHRKRDTMPPVQTDSRRRHSRLPSAS